MKYTDEVKLEVIANDRLEDARYWLLCYLQHRASAINFTDAYVQPAVEVYIAKVR